MALDFSGQATLAEDSGPLDFSSLAVPAEAVSATPAKALDFSGQATAAAAPTPPTPALIPLPTQSGFDPSRNADDALVLEATAKRAQEQAATSRPGPTVQRAQAMDFSRQAEAAAPAIERAHAVAAMNLDNRTPAEESNSVLEIGKGMGETAAKTAKAFNISLGSLPVAMDAIYGAATAAPHTDFQDWWFRKMVTPLDAAQKQLGVDELAPTHQKLAHSFGNLTDTLATVIAATPASEALPATEVANLTATKLLAGSASQAARAAIIPGLTDASEIANRVYAETGDSRKAAQAGAAAYLTTAMAFMVPASAEGGLPTRFATGAIGQTVSGEAGRVMLNAALPEKQRTSFEPSQVLQNAVMGGFLGAALGHRAPGTEANVVAPADQALEAAANAARSDALSKWDDFAKSLKTRTAEPSPLVARPPVGELAPLDFSDQAVIAPSQFQLVPKGGEQQAVATPANGIDFTPQAQAAQPIDRAAAVEQAIAANEAAQRARAAGIEYTPTPVPGAPEPTVGGAPAPVEGGLDMTPFMRERALLRANGLDMGGYLGEGDLLKQPFSPDTVRVMSALDRLAEINPAAADAMRREIEAYKEPPDENRAAKAQDTGALRAGEEAGRESNAASATRAEPSGDAAEGAARGGAGRGESLDRPAAGAGPESTLTKENTNGETLAESSEDGGGRGGRGAQRAQDEAGSGGGENAAGSGRRGVGGQEARGGPAEGGQEREAQAGEHQGGNANPEAAREAAAGGRAQAGNAPGADASGHAGLEAAAHEAATSPRNALPEPTDAQKEAGNYRKGHVRIAGLDVSIENPAGSKRRPEWPTLKDHYGYIRRTEGADGDHVDVFVKRGTPADYAGPVYVVDQVKPKGAFDEHKVVLGADSAADAREVYARNYTKGFRVGPVTEMSQEQFRAWLDAAKAVTKRPVKALSLSEWGDILGRHERSLLLTPDDYERAGFHDLSPEDRAAVEDFLKSVTHAELIDYVKQENAHGSAEGQRAGRDADVAAGGKPNGEPESARGQGGEKPLPPAGDKASRAGDSQERRAAVAADIEHHIGWGEVGGRMIRAHSEHGMDSGEVTGRTPWVRKSDMWPERPGPTRISEADARAALRRFVAGDRLTKSQERFIEYARKWLDEHPVTRPPEERRQNAEQRQRVADMAPEEMRKALLTDEITGLGNRRAWDEAPKKAVVASLDLDGLKWVNDNMGHEHGDELIRAVGKALKDEGLDAYHTSGDEFFAQFDHEGEAHEAMNRVRERLERSTITAKLADGSEATLKGVGFSYGTGPDTHTAEIGLQRDKSERQDAGHRSGRGEPPPGLARKPAESPGKPEGEAGPEVRPRGPMYARGALTPPFRVRFDGRDFEVSDVADAQRKWADFREEATRKGAGARDIGNGVEVRDSRGTVVAKIAYNGSVRTPEGREITSAKEARALTAAPALELKGETEAEIRQREAHGQKPLFSRGPVYYSDLERQVGAVKTESASPEQWKATVKNLKGVKADEIEWSGINDWLSMQEGKVTKQQVADYLKQNGVRVEETMLGEHSLSSDERQQHIDRLRVELDAKGYSIVDDPHDEMFALERRSDGKLFSDSQGAEDSDNFGGLLRVLPLDVYERAELYMEMREQQEGYRTPDGGTRYDRYTLPGGKNYRELLLTLPTKVDRTVLPEGFTMEGPHKKYDGSIQWEVEGPGPQTSNRYASGPTREVAIARFHELHSGAGQFRSSHFDQPNILAHVRFNERTDAEGKKVLFLEELQSDWAQKGKRAGFQPKNLPLTKDGVAREVYGKAYADLDAHTQSAVDTELDARLNPPDRGAAGAGAVPNAPFVGKTEAWVALALKRMIRYAAENGFDKIAFTNGDQQAARYDLSKHVNEVQARRHVDGTVELHVYAKDRDGSGQTRIDRDRIPASELADHVGKDLAEKIEKQATREWQAYTGLDLKVGGEGMKAFYDKIVPNVANDVLKKLGGGRVAEIPVNFHRGFDIESTDNGYKVIERGDTGNFGYFKTLKAAQEKLEEVKRLNSSKPQPGFDITPAMREKAMEGMPLFRQAADRPAGGMARGDLQEALKPLTERVRLPVKVHQSVEELRREPGFENAPSDAKGGYHAGRIHVVADNIADPLDAERTVARHEVTHAGIDRLYGSPEARRVALMDIVSKNKTLREAADRWYSRYGQEAVADEVRRGATPAEAEKAVRLDAIEEGLAYASEALGNRLNGWKSFVAAIQKGLRAMGLHRLADHLETASNAEVLSFLHDAREATEERGAGAGRLEPAFARGPQFDAERLEHLRRGIFDAEDAVSKMTKDLNEMRRLARRNPSEDKLQRIREQEESIADQQKALARVRREYDAMEKAGRILSPMNDERRQLTLTGETEGEIRARETREAAEAKAKQQREKAPASEDFTLTGSDRPVDVAEARGQKPLFARSRESEPLEFTPRAKSEDAAGEARAKASRVEREAEPAAAGIHRIGDAIAKVFAPATRGDAAKETAGIMRANLAQQARDREMADRALRGYAKMFDKMPVKENFAFIDAMESGSPLKDAKLQTAAVELRKLLDGRRQQVQDLGKGKLENFIENYFPHIWTDSNKAMSFFTRRPLQGSKNFLKKRTIATFKEGLEAGLEPVTSNPVELALLKAREMDRYIYGQKIFAEMKAAGLAKFVPFDGHPPSGWAKINDAIARVYHPTDEGMVIKGEFYAPEQAATLINNHLSPGLRGNAIYDAWRGAGNALNSAQLGLGAFHLGFTTLDAMISRVALGVKQGSRGLVKAEPMEVARGLGTAVSGVAPWQAFVNLYKGDRLLKAYLGDLKDPGLAPLVDALVQGGGRARMDPFYRMQDRHGLREALRLKQYWTAAKSVIPRVIDAINWPIFEYLVPRQKLGVFFDMAQDALRRNPGMTLDEKRATFGKLWDSVDNRMGEMVYDNLFWDRALKDGLMASVRSVGWNLGTFRELGGGVKDLRDIHSNGGLTDRTAYIAALPLMTAMIGAMTQYAYTGESPQEMKDLFFPRTGRKRPDGSPDRLSLPSYMKDVYEYMHDAVGFAKYGDDPLHTIKNKLHPLLSTVAQIIDNKDFYGATIRSPGDPAMVQVQDELKHLAKQVTPFGIRGYLQEAKTRKETPSLLGYLTSGQFLGVSPAPGYIVHSEAQEESLAISRQRDAQVKKFRQEVKDGAPRSDVAKRMRAAGMSDRDISYVFNTSSDVMRPRPLKHYGQ